MKIKAIILALLMFVFAQQSDAQFVISIRPSVPKVVRISSPSQRHIWIDEDWAWRNNNYAYTGGYWAAPPMGYNTWIPRHWKNTRRGWIWKQGHWR